MASQSQGIQQLLQAEKRAAEKVADARKRKARRLKQAKEEAQMEVEQYRREREQEFQSKQQAVSLRRVGRASRVVSWWDVYRVILQENNVVKDRRGSWWGPWHWSGFVYVTESGCLKNLYSLWGNCQSVWSMVIFGVEGRFWWSWVVRWGLYSLF
ncbi:ATPase H+ transporting V1 subunit G2 [Phyllostomus discolor]|uniref:V-type proton ATPase subunit G n=2 Tax=Boreoeutheria TaxID=1437010 RepID=A0A834EFW9_9CHIR|nr:ATPase H+ transporting V1 subunit G2 [Phyllostomus discolor]